MQQISDDEVDYCLLNWNTLNIRVVPQPTSSSPIVDVACKLSLYSYVVIKLYNINFYVT